MSEAYKDALLTAFANELSLTESFTEFQKLDLLVDLVNAIYAANQKVSA
jgi:hypothetical protein